MTRESDDERSRSGGIPGLATVSAVPPDPARERVIIVYGRMPVLEALRDDRRTVARLVIASNAQGPAVDEILTVAARRAVSPERLPADRIARISGNGRHDQGVAAAVVAPHFESVEEWLDRRDRNEMVRAVVLDGVTNPANVGLVVRTAVAAGIDGVVLPRAGSPDVGPLVIKASAGVAFDAPIVRAATARAALEVVAGAGFRLYGLAAPASSQSGRSLFDDAGFARRCAFVLGNESYGLSPAVADLVHEWVSIPLAGEVESLNVAVAAGVVCFELLRRRLVP